MPGRDPDKAQTDLVFARKTYRNFEGGTTTLDNVLKLLRDDEKIVSGSHVDFWQSPLENLGYTLRYFGQFTSPDRLLPKFGYASPGALYATQLYLEIRGIESIPSGYYYYHPVDHSLIPVTPIDSSDSCAINLHFLGKNGAIEPVYKNNIREVLEMEVGHMLELFDYVLPERGLRVGTGFFSSDLKSVLNGADTDEYLGSFGLVSSDDTFAHSPSVEVYVQAHGQGIDGLSEAFYHFSNGDLTKVSSRVIEKRHIIAINQPVYERSSVGISLLCKEGDNWEQFIALGRKLQSLQLNHHNFGFMSSGYSSKSGKDLPAALRLREILEGNVLDRGAFYFCVGGMISEDQKAHRGMNEDAVHMSGPEEMIKDDLVEKIPDYMVPNRVLVLDSLPLTVNGKVDLEALKKHDAVQSYDSNQPLVPPRNDLETMLAQRWKSILNLNELSVKDDFFELGGNSLTAVSLINSINKRLAGDLPSQTIFECPTIEKLAQHIQDSEQGQTSSTSSRLIRLSADSEKTPVFCWPGLGGYPMNLQLLAKGVSTQYTVYGVQAFGLNPGEDPERSIYSMAARDIQEIRRIQSHGPYRLWGYSFGARVAFETARQLEQGGEQVVELNLFAPGSPKVHGLEQEDQPREPDFSNKLFVAILYSVFARRLSGPAFDRCLEVATDETSFVTFITSRLKHLDANLVRQIIRVVQLTYSFEYRFEELEKAKLDAPIIVFKAKGDDYSFIDGTSGYSSNPTMIHQLEADHYSLLKEEGVTELLPLLLGLTGADITNANPFPSEVRDD